MTTSGSRDLGKLNEVISPVLSNEDNDGLISNPTPFEVIEAVFQIGPLKSIGSDWFPALFY